MNFSSRLSHLHRCLKSCATRSTYAVHEDLVVPKRAILEYQPATWAAEATPPFALDAMVADKLGGVQIGWESEKLVARFV